MILLDNKKKDANSIWFINTILYVQLFAYTGLVYRMGDGPFWYKYVSIFFACAAIFLIIIKIIDKIKKRDFWGLS